VSIYKRNKVKNSFIVTLLLWPSSEGGPQEVAVLAFRRAQSFPDLKACLLMYAMENVIG